MRSLIALLLLALATLAAAPAAAQVEGTYELVQINGQALPAPSPSEENVVMHGATLALTADGRFLMQARAGAADDTEPQEAEARGTWTASGDSLALTPDDGGADHALHFRWTLREGTLTLHDEEGDAYTFRRT